MDMNGASLICTRLNSYSPAGSCRTNSLSSERNSTRKRSLVCRFASSINLTAGPYHRVVFPVSTVTARPNTSEALASRLSGVEASSVAQLPNIAPLGNPIKGRLTRENPPHVCPMLVII